MIPVKDTAAVEQSNIEGESIALFVSEDISHIMGILTRIYSDEAAAVIREYAVNAYDEHVTHGVTRPIEVTTPTPFAPFLTIRDYAAGLSLDGLRSVYAGYGESTKRNSNAVTGMLGIGSKSGLAYAPSFNITSVHNGVKVLAQMKRNVEGGGEITIIDTVASDEPSGVEIKIPARDSWSLQRKAAHLFQFWPAGSVLVDGVEPTRLTGVTVTDNIMVCDGLSTDYIVMGNVPYPVEGDRLSTSLPHGKHVVAVVPIGTVKPAPSREALIYNEQTNVQVARIEQEMKDALLRAANEAVSSAKTHADALVAANEWRGVVKQTEFKWRGETVPTQFSVQHYVWRPNRGRYATSSDSIFYAGKNDHMDKIERMVLIHNFVNKQGEAYEEMSSQHRKKIRDWYESQGEALPSTIVVSQDTIGSPWLDGVATRVDWQQTILPYRKPVDPNKVRTTMGSQPIEVFDRTLGYYTDAADDYAWEGPFILTTPADRESFPVRQVVELFPDYTVVRLGRGRFNKFERLFGEDTEVIREYGFWTLWEASRDATMAALTDDDRRVLSPQKDDQALAQVLGGRLSELLDVELRDYLTSIGSATLSEAGKRYKALQSLSDYDHRMPNVEAADRPLNPYKRYPILGALKEKYWNRFNASADQMLDYMNGLALLSNRKGKK